MLLLMIDTVNKVGSGSFGMAEQFWDLLGRVLQVVIDGDDQVALGKGETAKSGIVLTVVFAQPDS